MKKTERYSAISSLLDHQSYAYVDVAQKNTFERYLRATRDETKTFEEQKNTVMKLKLWLSEDKQKPLFDCLVEVINECISLVDLSDIPSYTGLELEGIGNATIVTN